jgi:hypothetical protein
MPLHSYRNNLRNWPVRRGTRRCLLIQMALFKFLNVKMWHAVERPVSVPCKPVEGGAPVKERVHI